MGRFDQLDRRVRQALVGVVAMAVVVAEEG